MLLAPGAVACSFFSPSLNDYALTRAAGGESAVGGADGGSAGGISLSGMGGMPDVRAGSGGLPQGGSGADAGASGWTGVVTRGVSLTEAEVAVLPVVTTGLPSFAAYTSYDIADATAAQTKANVPLFKPYESSTVGFWDNLVAEQMQARVSTVLFPSHGVFTLDPKDMTGPDPMNPRFLATWVAAVERAGAQSLFRTAGFIDARSMQDVSNHLHGNPSGAQMDLSLASDWSDVFWLRGVKPLFDTIPQSYWLEKDGRPVVQMGGLLQTSFKNISGNLSPLLSAVAAGFHAAYGSYPAFVIDASWFSAEPALSTHAYVLGQNGLLKEDSGGRAFASLKGLTLGTVMAGYADPGYYEASGPKYHDASLLIPRKIKDADGSQVSTLATGMAAAVQNQAFLTVLQDFTGVKYWDGFYRSNAADWETPNEYLNLVRRYSDPATATLRLEAEGCDKFSDTTPGNSGTAFRRSGDLDVRALSANGGWAVTNTAAGEWIEFDKVDFSAGTYQFAAKHASVRTDNIDTRLQVIVDGEDLTPVITPETTGPNTFAYTLLGQRFMAHGTHDIRVRFLDGQLELDWLFVKKIDAVLSLKASSGLFASAVDGGGTSVLASGATATANERLTFDDLDGGSLLDGDRVYIQANNGLYLNVAPMTGVLSADQRRPGSGALFYVHKQADGAILAGDPVWLQTSDATHYVTVGSGGQLDGMGTALAAPQTFTVGAY
jgi:hypothetical protein